MQYEFIRVRDLFIIIIVKLKYVSIYSNIILNYQFGLSMYVVCTQESAEGDVGCTYSVIWQVVPPME